MPVTIGSFLNFCGQELSAEQIQLIRRLTAEFPNLSRTEMAATLCEWLGWRRPNGGLKIRECFQFLVQLHARGWI